MKNIIVGTAGHIDHGKTTLVRALTGVDTDRLEEEKRRGISIDLGFAQLDIGGVHLGFVDVPGHERFIRNMLAGAGGIDMALLVIGADEGIKPQTREHFDICRLLGIRCGVVAVTKSDLVDADRLGMVKREVATLTRASFLEDAPIVAVSGTTGAGLEELKLALSAAAEMIAPGASAGVFRLPIDRSFSLRGFGTVVTGTLVSGTLHPEDEVEVQPGGRRLRVRGVQVHGGNVEEASAGQRTAVNLSGVDSSELARGMTLTVPGLFASTVAADCHLTLLSSARPMKQGAPLVFHSYTTEAQAEVRLLSQEPGFVRLLFAEPVFLLPGDRFILRVPSPAETIGGGVVIDNAPPLRLRRARSRERAAALFGADPAQRLERIASEHPEGLSLAEAVRRMGLRPKELPARDLVVVRSSKLWLLTRANFEKQSRALHEALAGFHKANPLLPGMPKASAPVPTHLLDALLKDSIGFAVDGEFIRLASHRLALKADEDVAIGKIESLFRDAGLSVPAVAEVLVQSGLDPGRARSLLQILLRDHRLIRVSPDLIYHASAIATVKALLAARRGEKFAVPQFKEWTGVSRKYAIPLLEFLDRERVTRRAGDLREIL